MKAAPIAGFCCAVDVTWEWDGGSWLPWWHRLCGLTTGCMASGLALAQPHGCVQGFTLLGGGKPAMH